MFTQFIFAKCLYILVAPLLLQKTPFYSSLRTCLLGLSPQKIHQIKHKSQLIGSVFFFSRQYQTPYLGKKLMSHENHTIISSLTVATSKYSS